MSAAIDYRNRKATAPRAEPDRRASQRYSISRAILAAADPHMSCLERDVSDELRRGLPADVPQHGGVFIPTDALELERVLARDGAGKIGTGPYASGPYARAGLDTKTSTHGSELLFESASGFIAALRKKSRVLAMGGQLITGLRDNASFPKIVIGTESNWVDENTGIDQPEAVFATGNIHLASQPNVNDTLTVGPIVYTFKASASLATEITIGGTIAITATNITTRVNLDTATGLCTAVAGATDVALTAATGGVGGNSLALITDGVRLTRTAFAGGAGDPTFTQVALRPHMLMSPSISYSRQLLVQSTPPIDRIIASDIAAANASAIDRAVLHGSGVGPIPQGIYSASGVSSVAMGGVITRAKVIEMEAAVAALNADVGPMAFFSTPEVRKNARLTETFTGSGLPLWAGDNESGEMLDYQAVATNQALKTMGAGAEHGIVLGMWSDVLVGEWSAGELLVDSYSSKKRGMIEVNSFLMAGVALRHGESFCKGTGLTVT